MHLGEMLALKWRDVDLDAATLSVRSTLQKAATRGMDYFQPKTKRSRRHIALTQVAVEALRRHRAHQHEERLALGIAWHDHGLIFPNVFGSPMLPSNLRYRHFKPLLKLAGLPPIRFHDLPHTAATLMLSQGVHPKVVSEMLGHASISITLDLYSHVLPNMQKEAVSRMDAFLSGTE